MNRGPRTTSATDPAREPARRLDRLVALARAALLWERLWRGLIPPLVVAGLFVCVSWLGLWLAVPHWARLVGVLLFALALALSTFGLWRLGPASRRDALRRIDRETEVETGLAHRPASMLDDVLATGGHDPATDALWALHRRRAEADAASLRVGLPSPRAASYDRYALRGAIVVALFACAVIAGPQRYARLAAAFDFGLVGGSAAGTRTDAWIDPPPYTGKAPVLLDLAAAQDAAHPLAVSAPVGSTVIVRSAGGEAPLVEASGPLLPPAPPQAKAEARTGAKIETQAETNAKAESADRSPGASPGAAPGEGETRLVLHGDSRLTLRRGSRLLGSFALTAVPDLPPRIALRDMPKSNARGTLTLPFTASDDYGIGSAEVRFGAPRIDGEALAGQPLVEPPRAALPLPGASHGIGDGEATLDLADSPYAGTEVTMTLVARDEGGNEGRSEPYTITLPQKPFNNPLARALVEQRRILALEPAKRAAVAEALAALMLDPDTYGTKAGVYLGLRFAADELARARSKPQLVVVADYLWGMALLIENGDLSEAEKALRDAEKALRDAIDRHASADEIAKLTDNLQAAMDKFLKELAQQQDKQGEQQQADRGRPSKSISANDLQKLIERLKEQARSGNREEAKKALDELQDILENLKTAKRQKADPQSKAMAQSLNQLDQMMRDQQDLRDETFKRDQQGGEEGGPQSRSPSGRQGRQGQMGRGGQRQGGGQSPGGQSPGGGDDEQQSAQNGQRGGQQGGGDGGQDGEGGGGSLDQRQKALRDRLAAIQKKLKEVGQGERALGDAGDDMKEAEEALKDGDGSNGQAVDAQGRALDALRKGAKKLSEAMKQQGGEQGEGQGNGQANSEGDGSQKGGEGQQAADTDPLGRPRGGDNMLNSSARFDPLGVPAAQRAQRVLEELRRRLGDPSRAQEEIDYLERLLRSY